jgi:hypothetical protein
VRENEHLHVDAIRRARRLIYLENQYFTSPVIAAALADRLTDVDGPEVVLVSTGTSPSWFDRMTMDTARSQVLYRLEQADIHNSFFAFTPYTLEGERIIVHAKVAIYDDAVLRIGSTNLNNRSFGFDTECDVAAEPTDAAGRDAIRRFRQRTIGHWIGVDGEAFGAVEGVTGTVGEAILRFETGRMHLLGAKPPSRVERIIAEFQLGDPTSTRTPSVPGGGGRPRTAPRLAGLRTLISKSMISGRWSDAIRASGEKGAFTPVTTISGLVKQWSIRMAGKLDGKVLTDGLQPRLRWQSASRRVSVW